VFGFKREYGGQVKFYILKGGYMVVVSIVVGVVVGFAAVKFGMISIHPKEQIFGGIAVGLSTTIAMLLLLHR
jgi:hypothetical protein